jgi:PadR family transcriptional regulator PadR
MQLTESLGQFEQLILTAVMVLEDDAYGMQIHSKVCELADREMNLGSVYVTLDRLQKKSYVSSKVADGGPERGSKPRRFYSLKPAGLQALRESVETATRISDSFWSIGKWKHRRPRLDPLKHPRG